MRPVFLADEALDLQLAVADEAERHRLDAAGRAGARQLAPEHRRQCEADEIVERPAGEIGLDQRRVDRSRGLAMASSTDCLVIALKTTRLMCLSLSTRLLRSTSSTCQEIASPSRSGSVARISPSAPLRAVAMSESRLDEAESTDQDMAKSSSGRTEPSLGGRSRTCPNEARTL
jgi:hypothetical protein